MQLPSSPDRHLPLLASLVLLVLALPARAGVLVVDAAMGPGADFAAIQPAVDAALEGDTILVRSGTYAQFTITAKSLSVVADGPPVQVHSPGPNQFVPPPIRVQNLALHQRVLVRGMRTNFGLSVQSCAGAVWLEDIQTAGATASNFHGAGHGATVSGSSQVTFARCILRGETIVSTFALQSAHGLVASSSNVQLFDCELRGGGANGDAQLPFGSIVVVAGVGLLISVSTVTIVGCAIEGGAGDFVSGSSVCTASHLPGGAGVWFSGQPAILRSAASTAVGGSLDISLFCPGVPPFQGPAILGTGTIVPLPGFARHLRANTPVRGGEILAFDLEGQAGEVPVILVSADHVPLPFLNGTLLVGLPPVETFVLAPLPTSGAAALAFSVPGVGSLVGSLTLYAQAAFLDPSAAVWLGAGTSIVLLDPAI